MSAGLPWLLCSPNMPRRARENNKTAVKRCAIVGRRYTDHHAHNSRAYCSSLDVADILDQGLLDDDDQEHAN